MSERMTHDERLVKYIQFSAERLEYNHPTKYQLPKMNLWQWEQLGNEQNHEDVD